MNVQELREALTARGISFDANASKGDLQALLDAANAAFTVNDIYAINITGFTYIRDYALVRGTCNQQSVSVIIGDKLSFPMSDMFMLKSSAGIKAIYRGEKTVNGKTYQQFAMQEIMF